METRKRIQRYLAATPGASTQMVAEHLGVDASTADYHLRRLRREARVTYETNGREVAWFGAGCRLCPLLRAAAPAFRRADVALVALALDEIPSTIRALAEGADVETGQARWAFEVLRRVGIAQRSRTGRPQLVPGADLCVAKARAGEACDRWGSCAPSRKRMAEESQAPAGDWAGAAPRGRS